MELRKIFAGLVLACFSLLSLSGKDKDGVIKILAIGNCFSEDAVEQYLWDIAAADGRSMVVGNLYIGGCSLETHLGNAEGDRPEYRYRKTDIDGVRTQKDRVTLQEALSDETWDYISFQQVSQLSGVYATWEDSLPELYSYVKARTGKDTKFIIHQTWAYSSDSSHGGFANYGRDQMKMYTSITDAVQKAAKLQKIKIIVPSGTAIQNLRTSFIGDNVTRDGYHLDLYVGRYTAACAWYETLFGRSVIGNSYRPDGLPEEYRMIAQRAAHEAVRHPFSVTSLADMPENIR